MNEINLVLPPVPSVNQLYATFRGHRIMSRKGKTYKAGAGVMANYEKTAQKWVYSIGHKIVMELRFFWPDRRKRDCDNSLKLLQDSFTGILYDDDKWVLPRVMDWNLDRENPRVEIKLWRFDESV